MRQGFQISAFISSYFLDDGSFYFNLCILVMSKKNKRIDTFAFEDGIYKYHPNLSDRCE